MCYESHVVYLFFGGNAIEFAKNSSMTVNEFEIQLMTGIR